ncbi:MAG: hypothetical protein ACREGG_01280 [Candidatus Saccharimonadales bacterium]
MKKAVVILVLLASFGTTLRPAAAFDLFSHCVTESDGTQVCGPCAANPNTPSCVQVQNEGGANNRVTGPKNVINIADNILALAAGVAAVIMIIIGGFTMVTSAGNSESITAARRRIIGAVVGLVVIALAWVIIRFVTDRLIQ